MNVDTERKMIWDQIFSGRSDVHWVEVGEFGFKLINFFERDWRGRWERSAGEDVVPDFVGHLFVGDAERSNYASVDWGT